MGGGNMEPRPFHQIDIGRRLRTFDHHDQIIAAVNIVSHCVPYSSRIARSSGEYAMIADLDFIHDPVKALGRFEDHMRAVHNRFISSGLYQLPSVVCAHFKRLLAGFEHQIFVVTSISTFIQVL
jgi:hypothetical protein